MKLLVATNNQGKQKEFRRILGSIGVELVFPEDVGLGELEVEETGSTFRENALLKARQFAKKSKLLTIADDSGLEVKFLGDQPGANSKRFFPGSDGDRNNHLLSLMSQAVGEDREALFKTVLCLFNPNTNEAYYFEGIYRGVIAMEANGNEGFGYDPIFIPEGETKTSAQLGLEYKNQHSHRYLAIKKLAKYLEDKQNDVSQS